MSQEYSTVVGVFSVSGRKLIASAVAAAVAGSLAITSSALAGSKREAKTSETVVIEPAIATTPPLITLISLNRQRLYIYDANGLVVQSRVSTGRSGYDTPKGIYSILHKKVEHASNLYDSAPMPHMQRLLWSGIALHGGEVPGYPASHGCIRVPYGFDKTFYSITRLNDRVIITPDVQAPVRIDHPRLFSSLPETKAKAALLHDKGEARTQYASVFGNDAEIPMAAAKRTLEDVMAESEVENQRLITANDAAKAELAIAKDRMSPVEATLVIARDNLKKAVTDEKTQAKTAAKAARAAADAAENLAAISEKIAAKLNKTRADRLIAMRADEAKAKDKADRARAEADKLNSEHLTLQAAVNGYQRQFTDAAAKSKSAKADLALRTSEEAASTKALEDFQLTQRNFPKPLSIFISAKTGYISLRQGMEPVAEGAAVIAGRNRPVGNYVFTATGWRDESHTKLNWSVVAANDKGDNSAPRGRESDAGRLPPPTSAIKAQAALDRILSIPDNVALKIAELVKPGSTLIISDYDMSRSETGKGTDFIVQMPEVLARNWSPEYLALKRAGKTRLASRSQGSWLTADSQLYYTKPPRTVWLSPPKQVIVRQSPHYYRPSLARSYGFNFD